MCECASLRLHCIYVTTDLCGRVRTWNRNSCLIESEYINSPHASTRIWYYCLLVFCRMGLCVCSLCEHSQRARWGILWFAVQMHSTAYVGHIQCLALVDRKNCRLANVAKRIYDATPTTHLPSLTRCGSPVPKTYCMHYVMRTKKCDCNVRTLCG